MQSIQVTYLHAIQISFCADDGNGNLKWREMLEEVGAGTRSDPKVAKLFKAFSGKLTRVEMQLFNMMLVDWQLNLKKERFKTGECPWYQPSSQRKDYFTFWGFLKRQYDFEVNEKDFRNFDGSVWNVMSAEIEKREKVWVSTTNCMCIT